MEDNKRRKVLKYGVFVLGGFGAGAAAVPFIQSLSPDRDTLRSLATVRVDVSGMKDGDVKQVAWTSKPVFVVKRSRDDIGDLKLIEHHLVDPHSEHSTQPDEARNFHRSIRPDILVVLNICTHLGCTLLANPEHVRRYHSEDYWRGGFDCPCHTSYFDMAGRVYKDMPADKNLVVPPHRYVSETVIEIG